MKDWLVTPLVLIGASAYGAIQVSAYILHSGGPLDDVGMWLGAFLLVLICSLVWHDKYKHHDKNPEEAFCPLFFFVILMTGLAVTGILGIGIPQIQPIARFIHFIDALVIICISFVYLAMPRSFRSDQR